MKKITEFIKTYPERVILGIAVLFLLIVAYKLLSKPEDEDVVRVKTKLSEIETILRQSLPPELPEVTYPKEVKSFWGNLNKINLKPNSNWVMYRRPVYEVKFKKLKEIPLKKNLPPILKSVEPFEVKEEEERPEYPDRVTIVWEKNTETDTKTTGYKIYRKKSGEPDFSVVLELSDGTITSTENSNLEPETEYTYYVTALTNEKRVVGGRQESEPSNQVTVITPEIVDLNPLLITGDMLYVGIHKYINGKWDKTRQNVKKGERVGKIRAKRDFRTPYILDDLQEFTKKVPVGGDSFVTRKGGKVSFKHRVTGKVVKKSFILD